VRSRAGMRGDAVSDKPRSHRLSLGKEISYMAKLVFGASKVNPSFRAACFCSIAGGLIVTLNNTVGQAGK
jgi:hypothetical protein